MDEEKIVDILWQRTKNYRNQVILNLSEAMQKLPKNLHRRFLTGLYNETIPSYIKPVVDENDLNEWHNLQMCIHLEVVEKFLKLI